MRAIRLGVILAAIAFGRAALAEPRSYQVAPQRGGTGIVLEIPYSLGKHKQSIAEVQGEVRVDRETLAVTGGRLAVPIEAIRSDSAERDCHLRESLGLDYERSRFPEEHVCTEDRLPASGPDSVIFPEIRLDLKSSRALDDPKLLEEGKPVRTLVQASWTIHGVTRPAVLALLVSADPEVPGALRVRGRTSFLLRDYGIVVKSAKVLFATISVGEKATALLDVRVVPTVGGGA